MRSVPANESEPAMTTVRTFHVRYAETAVDILIDAVIDLLAADAAIIDLSGHDSAGNRIELRVSGPDLRDNA